MFGQRRRRWPAMWHYGANASFNRRSRLYSFLHFLLADYISVFKHVDIKI